MFDYINEELFQIALTHKSYANEHRLNYNYERLEFLGDRVIDLIITDYLYNNKTLSEGEMTVLRSKLVCENAFFEYASKINLTNYIKIGNGEKIDNKTIVADIFEAFFAAWYLKAGYEKTKKILLNLIVPFIESNKTFFNNYKAELQENAHTYRKSIIYEVIKEEGPAHNKTFKVQVLIDNILFGIGVGKSKKEAEQNAACDALNKVAKL